MLRKKTVTKEEDEVKASNSSATVDDGENVSTDSINEPLNVFVTINGEEWYLASEIERVCGLTRNVTQNLKKVSPKNKQVAPNSACDKKGVRPYIVNFDGAREMGWRSNTKESKRLREQFLEELKKQDYLERHMKELRLLGEYVEILHKTMGFNVNQAIVTAKDVIGSSLNTISDDVWQKFVNKKTIPSASSKITTLEFGDNELRSTVTEIAEEINSMIAPDSKEIATSRTVNAFLCKHKFQFKNENSSTYRLSESGKALFDGSRYGASIRWNKKKVAKFYIEREHLKLRK